PAVGGAGDGGQRRDGLDLRGDLGVGRGHDLGAVAEVHLVAVVPGRVVAGGDLDPGDRAEVPDREGEDGGRQRAGQDGRPQAGAGHHGGGVARELRRLVAGVVADDDETAVVALPAQVRGETGGGADHDRAVHPHRTGPELTAETGGAEL